MLNRRMHILSMLFTGVMVSALASAAAAATYTVCSSGCDETAIQQIFDKHDLAPGDIVEVRADTPGGTRYYYETITPGADDAGGAGIPVTLRARKGDTIYIDGQRVRVSAIRIGVDYLTVEGFYLTNHTGYTVDVRSATGVVVQDCTLETYANEGIYVRFGDNVHFRNNRITTADGWLNAQTDGVYMQESTGITAEGNHITIRNDDEAHNDCFQAYKVDGIVLKNNYCEHDNAATSHRQHIYVESSTGDVLIYNNALVSTGSTGSNVLSIKNKGYGTVGVVRIYNNSIYINGAAAAGIITDDYVDNPYIINNSVYINNSLGYCIDAASTALEPSRIDNNLCYKPSGTNNMNKAKTLSYDWAGWRLQGYDTNGINHAPRYLLPPGNLRLGADSVCINSGRSLGEEYAADKDGNPRGTTWDIGAYEFDSLPPASPGGLHEIK